MRFAAIDIGTNTARLLVAEANSSTKFRDLSRRLAFTRLGEGVDSNSLLKKEAIDRTLLTITDYLAECGELEVNHLRFAGTSALRDASNAVELSSALERISGVPLEILSGEDEARLSFIGATSDLTPGMWLVCDIGGGSTELVLGGQKIEARISMDVGSVRMKERFLKSDPAALEEILTMEGSIDAELGEANTSLGGKQNIQRAEFIGVAGTVTTVAALHLRLTKYDPSRTHGAILEYKDVMRQYRRLAGMTNEDRKKIDAMPEGRADVIVAGTSILARVMDRWSIDRVRVSEKDILDGLVLDLMRTKLEQEGTNG